MPPRHFEGRRRSSPADECKALECKTDYSEMMGIPGSYNGISTPQSLRESGCPRAYPWPSRVWRRCSLLLIALSMALPIGGFADGSVQGDGAFLAESSSYHPAATLATPQARAAFMGRKLLTFLPHKAGNPAIPAAPSVLNIPTVRPGSRRGGPSATGKALPSLNQASSAPGATGEPPQAAARVPQGGAGASAQAGMAMQELPSAAKAGEVARAAAEATAEIEGRQATMALEKVRVEAQLAVAKARAEATAAKAAAEEAATKARAEATAAKAAAEEAATKARAEATAAKAAAEEAATKARAEATAAKAAAEEAATKARAEATAAKAAAEEAATKARAEAMAALGQMPAGLPNTLFPFLMQGQLPGQGLTQPSWWQQSLPQGQPGAWPVQGWPGMQPGGVDPQAAQQPTKDEEPAPTPSRKAAGQQSQRQRRADAAASNPPPAAAAPSPADERPHAPKAIEVVQKDDAVAARHARLATAKAAARSASAGTRGGGPVMVAGLERGAGATRQPLEVESVDHPLAHVFADGHAVGTKPSDSSLARSAAHSLGTAGLGLGHLRHPGFGAELASEAPNLEAPQVGPGSPGDGGDNDDEIRPWLLPDEESVFPNAREHSLAEAEELYKKRLSSGERKALNKVERDKEYHTFQKVEKKQARQVVKSTGMAPAPAPVKNVKKLANGAASVAASQWQNTHFGDDLNP
eukprot:jgi/Mesvir1/27702/Mv07413-RA.4